MGQLITENKNSSLAVQLTPRICPVCGSENNFKKEMFSQPEANTLSFEDLKSSWFGFFKEKVFFSYYRCQRCAVLFCKDYFSLEQLCQLYGKMPENMADVPPQAILKTQKDYFRVLKKYSKLDQGYLEIGPDVGSFTRYCAEAKSFSKFFLFEPNQAVHEELAKTVQGQAFDIRTEMFDYSNVPDASVSTVVMIQVLDHLLDPREMLINLRKKMTGKNAVLFIVTHDESSLLAKLIKAKWPPYCLQHPQLFSPESIKKLLNETGFDVKQSVKSYNYFPFLYLLKHFLWVLGFKKVNFQHANSFLIPLKLGNIITIASPK